MPPKTQSRTTTTKKPISAASKPSTTPKKPATSTVRPQTKKPASTAARTSTVSKAPAVKSPASKPANKSVSRPTPQRVTSQSAGAVKQTKESAPAAGGNWINRTVQNSIAGVGNYAGGFINGIGASVNKVGEGVGAQITDRTRGWGQGVAGYGNSIKDSVGVGGPRVATAGNPLGIAGAGSAKGAPKAGQVSTRSAGKASASNPLGI